MSCCRRARGRAAIKAAIGFAIDKEISAMPRNYAIDDDVFHQVQGPQGRTGMPQRSLYKIISCMPIEADGRPRYRIRSETEKLERVVTEEQIFRSA
jgi:hypothetical protein